MATQEQVEQIIKLFIGYFDRAPAPGGTNYWTGRFEASEEGPAMTWAEIAESFSVQSETTALYPLLDSEDRDPSQFTKESLEPFLNSVFMNVLGRPIQDAGLEYYSGQIISGERTVGEAILDIINGANSGTDKQTIDNKVAVSVDFFEKTNAIEGFVFDDEAREVATSLLKDVTSDPDTVAPAQAKTQDFVDDRAGDTPGVTINLTTDADVPGGSGNGADTQGTGNADTYEGTVQQSGTGTLQSGDSIAAGGGDDTLNARLVSSTTSSLGDIITLNATSLEHINVINQVFGFTQFLMDVGNVTGLEQVTLTDGNDGAGVVFSDVAEGTLLRMVDVQGVLGIDFEGSRAAGNDDSFDLYIEDTGSDEGSASLIFTENQFSGTDEDFEIGNIETGGTTFSSLNLDSLALNQINVTGSQMLHVEDRSDKFEELEAFDASGMTGGGVRLDADGTTTADFAFMGSDFDDELELSNDLLSSSSALSLNGGDGTDTIAQSSLTNSTEDAINDAEGFEVLKSLGRTTTMNASDYDDIDTFVFDGQGNSGNRLSISGVTDDDRFIFTDDAGGNDEMVQFSANTVGQSLTFEMQADARDNGNIVFTASSNNNDVAAVGFSGSATFQDVTIVSSGTNEDANLILAQNSNNNFYAIDNFEGPTNFNITGSQALTIQAAEGVELESGSGPRGFRDSVNLDGSSATGDLRIAGSTAADALEGGAGDDIFYGLGGNDVLTGNDGMDQFRIANWSGVDTITDFTSGEDKVGLNRIDFDNTNATADGRTLDSDDYIENVSSIANLSSAEDDKLIELQTGASTNQIANNTSSASVDAFVLVYNTDTDKAELWYDSDWSTSGGRNQVVTFDNIESLVDTVGLSNTDFVEYTF